MKRTGGRRVSEIRDELGTMMNEKVAVFRDEKGLKEAHEIVRRLKDEAKPTPRSTTRARSSTRTCWARSSSATCSTAPSASSSPRWSARSRAAPSSARTIPKRNDDEWLKHIDISLNGSDVPKVSYSPVTITKWEPQERTY